MPFVQCIIYFILFCLYSRQQLFQLPSIDCMNTYITNALAVEELYDAGWKQREELLLQLRGNHRRLMISRIFQTTKQLIDAVKNDERPDDASERIGELCIIMMNRVNTILEGDRYINGARLNLEETISKYLPTRPPATPSSVQPPTAPLMQLQPLQMSMPGVPIFMPNIVQQLPPAQPADTDQALPT